MRPDYCPICNEPCQSLCDTPCSTQQRYTTNAMKVRQAVAQALAQSEPVAWRTFDGEGGYDYHTYEYNEDYAVKWDANNPKHKGWVEPLYTTPPQRTWNELTDEEYKELHLQMGAVYFYQDYGRAIESKLKAKNAE